MPHVDDGSLVTNSDAAMWRQDHASAIRYIEALEAENARLKAELVTLKARRCETCRFRDERGWCEINARSTPSNGFCSEWEGPWW